LKQLIISILILLGMGFSQEPPSIHQVETDAVEIVSYRIYPSSHPTMGCWSELEMVGEELMDEVVRDKLIDMIIKIELYHEVPQYITIQNRQYYLLRLPIDSFHDYKLGILE
jgi:hypothetical protein